MPQKDVLTLLSGGDRRTIGRSDQAAAMVSPDPKLFPSLIAGLWPANPLLRMRSADATEKVTGENAGLVRSYKKEVLGLLSEAMQQELRWHLALMVPRLTLNPKERALAIATLTSYLDDRSSIVKTFALQGLSDLARDDPDTRAEVIEILRKSARTGTPAMKARSRKLLLSLQRD